MKYAVLLTVVALPASAEPINPCSDPQSETMRSECRELLTTIRKTLAPYQKLQEDIEKTRKILHEQSQKLPPERSRQAVPSHPSEVQHGK